MNDVLAAQFEKKSKPFLRRLQLCRDIIFSIASGDVLTCRTRVDYTIIKIKLKFIRIACEVVVLHVLVDEVLDRKLTTTNGNRYSAASRVRRKVLLNALLC